MTITELIAHPAAISALIAGLFAALMKYMDHRKEGKTKWSESTDNERRQLSEDEKDFRLSIIEELRKCKDELKERNDKIEHLYKEVLELKAQLLQKHD